MSPVEFDRELTADAVTAICNAVEGLGDEVYGDITSWTDDDGCTNAKVGLNWGTFYIPPRIDRWSDAMEEFCEHFGIRDGETIVLYNIHERWLEPLDSYDLKSRFRSKGKFIPFLKRRK